MISVVCLLSADYLLGQILFRAAGHLENFPSCYGVISQKTYQPPNFVPTFLTFRNETFYTTHPWTDIKNGQATTCIALILQVDAEAARARLFNHLVDATSRLDFLFTQFMHETFIQKRDRRRSAGSTAQRGVCLQLGALFERE